MSVWCLYFHNNYMMIIHSFHLLKCWYQTDLYHWIKQNECFSETQNSIKCIDNNVWAAVFPLKQCHFCRMRPLIIIIIIINVFANSVCGARPTTTAQIIPCRMWFLRRRCVNSLRPAGVFAGVSSICVHVLSCNTC